MQSTLNIVIYNKESYTYQEQGKHVSCFQENAWLENLKHEWSVCSSVEAPVPTQQGRYYYMW